MIIKKGNILADLTFDAICFTSNGIIKKNGALTMGAGVAKVFRDRFDGLDQRAGAVVSKHGNRCQIVSYEVDPTDSLPIVAFPTKHHWRDPSDMALIKKSAQELMSLADRHEWERIALTKPGCGMGGLQWNEVETVIAPILDDRVTIFYL